MTGHLEPPLPPLGRDGESRTLWTSLLSFAAVFSLLISTADAQTGVVKGAIVNGTTGEPGSAETLTLYDLASGMEPVAFVEHVSGSFTLEDIDIAGGRPFLLQASSGGVSYNEQINFAGGPEIETTITVYDVTTESKDIEIRTARYLIRREHDQLKIDKLFVVENTSEPKRTVYHPEGAFRFALPPGSEEYSVSASSASGMPVPQTASPLADGSGYAAETALKPGITDIAISYVEDYSTGSYHLQEQAFYQLPELMVLVAPADLEVTGDGWESLGPEPQGRFSVFRLSNVEPGNAFELDLSGGSEHAQELVSPSSSDGSSGSSQMNVTTLPDPLRPQLWILVLLMAAALAYGLLASLIPTDEDRSGKVPKERGKH